MPPYTAVPLDTFGGLNLVDDPHDIGFRGATAASNVEFTRHGSIKPRAGFTKVPLSTAGTTQLGAMCFYKSSAGRKFIVAETNTNTVIPLTIDGNADGGTLSAAAPLSNNGMVRYGDSTNGPRLYLVNNTATVRRLDDTTWGSFAAPTGIVPTCVAVKPGSNRLVLAAGDVVFFSDPDAPETFQTDNFVRLDAGDGESIVAVTAWRELLFVFKQTKFYVFTGESVDAAGGPIFNYRTVAANQGVEHHGMAVAGDGGVYFTNATGLYVTTGDAPVLMSREIGIALGVDPWMGTSIVYHNNMVLVQNRATSTTSTVIVFDTITGMFATWSMDASRFATGPNFASASTFPTLYIAGSTSKKVGAYGGLTDDADTGFSGGTSITWTYTSGADAVGNTERKVLRDTRVFGSTDVSLKVATNEDASATVALTRSASDEMVYRRAVRGTFFTFTITGTKTVDSAPADAIDRLVFYLREAEATK